MALEQQEKTPEQREADNVAFARECRAKRTADPRLGRVGGWEEIWDDYADADGTGSAAAPGRASQ